MWDLPPRQVAAAFFSKLSQHYDLTLQNSVEARTQPASTPGDGPQLPSASTREIAWQTHANPLGPLGRQGRLGRIGSRSPSSEPPARLFGISIISFSAQGGRSPWRASWRPMS